MANTRLWDELYIPGEDEEAPTQFGDQGEWQWQYSGPGAGPDGSSFEGPFGGTPWAELMPDAMCLNEDTGYYEPCGHGMGYYTIDPTTGEEVVGGQIGGCLDPDACNYMNVPNANYNTGCNYPPAGYNCDGSSTADDDGFDPGEDDTDSSGNPVWDPDVWTETGTGCPEGFITEWQGAAVGNECVPILNPEDDPTSPEYQAPTQYGAQSEGAFHNTLWQELMDVPQDSASAMGSFLERNYDAIGSDVPWGEYDSAQQFADVYNEEIKRYFSNLDIGPGEQRRKEMMSGIQGIYGNEYSSLKDTQYRLGEAGFSGAGSAVFAEPSSVERDVDALRRDFRQSTFMQEEQWMEGFWNYIEGLQG
jgi:hypothetical protein